MDVLVRVQFAESGGGGNFMLYSTSVFPHTGMKNNMTHRIETCYVIKLPLGNDRFTAEGSRVEFIFVQEDFFLRCGEIKMHSVKLIKKNCEWRMQISGRQCCCGTDLLANTPHATRVASAATVVVLGGFMEAFIRSLNILCAS